jgi:DnaJ-class molecular chaperone
MCKQHVNVKYKDRCKNCNGKGWVKVYPHSDETSERRACPVCKGSGIRKLGQ